MRLVTLLGMLGSNQDGERAVAGLLASQMLRKRALTWDALFAGSEAQEARQPGMREEVFVAALVGRQRTCTPGQKAKLAQIAVSLCAKEFV